MHPSKKAQIEHLKVNKALTNVFNKYADFVDIFSAKLAVEFFKHMRIKDYAIKWMDNQQLLYGLIYSLGPIKLEMLKTYVENNLTNSFIRSFKSFAEVSIFFDKKLDGSQKLCVDYQDLNNLTV